MNTQKVVTTTVENKQGATIKIRQCSEPNEKATIIYSQLKYNTKFLLRKKSVWTTGNHQKKLSINNQHLADP